MSKAVKNTGKDAKGTAKANPADNEPKTAVNEAGKQVDLDDNIAEVTGEPKGETEAQKAWREKMQGILDAQEAAKQEKIKAAEEAKKNKKKNGVIVEILTLITDSGDKGTTEAEIVDVLVEKFPNRDKEGMTKTVKSQIGGKLRPLRMEREKLIVLDIFEEEATETIKGEDGKEDTVVIKVKKYRLL